MNLTFPVDAKLKDGSPVQLALADNQDIEPLRQLYRVIVEEGASYPHDRFPDQDAFMDYSPSPNTLLLPAFVAEVATKAE